MFNRTALALSRVSGSCVSYGRMHPNFFFRCNHLPKLQDLLNFDPKPEPTKSKNHRIYFKICLCFMFIFRSTGRDTAEWIAMSHNKATRQNSNRRGKGCFRVSVFAYGHPGRAADATVSEDCDTKTGGGNTSKHNYVKEYRTK